VLQAHKLCGGGMWRTPPSHWAEVTPEIFQFKDLDMCVLPKKNFVPFSSPYGEHTIDEKF